MPYNPKNPSASLKQRIKSRYPKATSKDIRLFVRVWNEVFGNSQDESKAFSTAWGVLKKHMKKKRQKRAEILSYLVKLANDLDHSQLSDEADQIDFLIEQIMKA